jgi:hypothetical protein
MPEREPDRFVPFDEWARGSIGRTVRIRARLHRDSRHMYGRLDVEGTLFSFAIGTDKATVIVGPVVIDMQVWFITDWARIEDCPRD